MSAMRCFVAFDLAPRITDRLAAAQMSICQLDPRWTEQKWVRPENLHLTVSFLGEIESDTVPMLIDSVGRALVGLQPVRFRVGSFVARPSASRATMVWARVDDGGTVSSVATAVGSAVGVFESVRGRRRFTPHITLVRARHDLRVCADLDGVYASSRLQDLVVSDPLLTLYESRLTSQGPHYTPHASWTVGDGSHEVDARGL